jgi:hypothetical protein
MDFKKMKDIFFIMLMSISSLSVLAQGSSINANVFGSVVNRPLQEKIFAHTDKNFYLAGEILWFKLYDVSADSLRPLNLSNVAYVEILNANQKPVLQATIALNNGSGNGSFYLTSFLTSGNYIFRAYTNWMKNFGADAYFQKQITIVNTLTRLAKTITKDSDNYDIGFFPEGGDLVAGIESKIAFKVADKYGNGITCSGNIIDKNNRSMVSFSTLKFGMGSFYFTPESNHTYSAIINIGNKTATRPLPAVDDKGYVMHLSDVDEKQCVINVHTNENIHGPVYLIAYNGNKINAALMQTTDDNGNTSFTIQKNNLASGVTHLTVFNSDKLPVCERLIFIKPAQMQLSVSPDNATYTTRSPIKMNITTAGSSEADLSMSVYLIDSLQMPDEENILNYLWLTAELKGRIESPQYYFTNNTAGADSALDNLLLTQGWSRFKTDNTQTVQPVLSFVPEHEGHIIQGKVTDKTSGLPAKDIRVYLSVPGKYFRFASAVSDDSGKVFFDIKDAYGSSELVVQTAEEDSMYRVEIADPYSYQVTDWKPASFNFSEDKLQQLSHLNLAMLVQNAYTINQLNSFSSPVLDSNAFFGPPDAKYNLDDFVRFNTMEEVLREYVHEINVRNRQGNFSLVALDPRNHAVFENNPLVLVDGVPIFDMNKLMAYNPLKIKKAEVMARKYYLNSFVADGILSYSTYKGDLDGFRFDPSTVELSYDGLQLQREFYSPQYLSQEQKQSRLPDYRNVLYWSPQIITNSDAQLSFYTSDIKGKYIAIVQGINEDGKAGYSETQFEVK